MATIDARGYKGIDTRRDPVRTYPAKDVAANLVGFMNANDDAGEGAELMFDTMLSGKDGSATYETGGGNRIPLGDNSTVPPKSGHDLSLTIDRDVQWYTQRVVRQAVQGSGGSSGAAVVMDTHTGQLLGLADYPTFDANQPSLSPESDLGSRALRDVYEPGSVEKVLTASSLIDAGKVTPDTRITVPSQLTRGSHVIHDYFPHGRIHLTLTGVIAKSSNIGTVLAASQFKHQELYDYLRKFGLGQRTAIGVKGETAGVLADWKNWSQINQDTIAFGQGLAVNAVQMAAAVNVVANGGVYVKPSLIKGRGDHLGRREGRLRPVLDAPGDQPARREAHRPDDGGGDQPVDRHGRCGRHRRLPGRRQDGHRAAGRQEVRLLRRHVHGLVRRVRAGRRPALPGLRGGPGPEERRRRRVDRRTRGAACRTPGRARRRAPGWPRRSGSGWPPGSRGRRC